MSKKNLYALVISFLLLIAVIILNRISFTAIRNHSERVDHTREVITEFETLSNHFKSAQIYTPAYDTSNLRNFYNLYKKETESVGTDIRNLKKLVRDNASQDQLVDSLSSLIATEIPILLKKNITEIVGSGEGHRLNKYFLIHELINRGIRQEEKLLIEREKRLNNSIGVNNLLTTAFGVVGVAILLFTFFSIFFLSRRRRWLEGFLESILNTSENGIVNFKAVRRNGVIVDFKIEFVNEAIDKLMNIKAANLIGKRLTEAGPYAIESGSFEKYKTVVETGKPVEFETLFKRNGIEKWLLVSLVKLGDGLTASFHNITQLKNYEEELKEKISELERSNTELEQYAYVASHDLQEPLRKIRSFGSYLQDTQAQKLDQKGQQQLQKIMASAERMSVLIRDILSFSSLKKDDQFVSTDLNKIVQAVLQDLDLLIAQKDVRIEVDTLPVIEAIPLQMNQLFYNLLTNSLKFSRQEETPLIKITCRLLEEKEKKESFLKNVPYYEIQVRDNGIGFNQEYAEQVFGLFKRLNDKQTYAGSGIGLALCRKVTENHHGVIRAEGRENEGAVFYICLPERLS